MRSPVVKFVNNAGMLDHNRIRELILHVNIRFIRTRTRILSYAYLRMSLERDTSM